MRLRVASCLLVLGVLFGGSVLTAEGASFATDQPPTEPLVAQQQPTPPVSAPRFSTIPPLPPAPTPTTAALPPTPTRIPIATLPPVRVVPPVPPITAPAPLPTVAPASVAPRAGGIPMEVAWLVLTGSVTALGGGIYLFRRSRTR